MNRSRFFVRMIQRMILESETSKDCVDHLMEHPNPYFISGREWFLWDDIERHVRYHFDVKGETLYEWCRHVLEVITVCQKLYVRSRNSWHHEKDAGVDGFSSISITDDGIDDFINHVENLGKSIKSLPELQPREVSPDEMKLLPFLSWYPFDDTVFFLTNGQIYWSRSR